MRKPTSKTYLKGLILTAIGVLILTPDSLLIRLMDANLWVVSFWRGLISGLCLVSLLVAQKRLTFFSYIIRTGRKGVFAIIVYFVGTISFVYSINTTLVAHTLVILATIPMFSALLSLLLFAEPISKPLAITIVATFLGILVIASGSLYGTQGEGSISGDLAALLSALCFAGSLSFARDDDQYDPIPTVGLAGLLIAVFSFVMEPQIQLAGDAWIPALLMGCVVVPFSFVLIFVGPRYIPMPEAGLLMLLETVLGPLWVWLVIDEFPSAYAFVGGAIVLFSLVSYYYSLLRRR